VKSTGIRVGNWLSQRQAQALLKRARHLDGSRVARSRHPRGASRLWPPAIGSGGADVCAHSAARRALVHRRSRWKARPRPDGTRADVGENRDRRVDGGCWRRTGHVFRPTNRMGVVTANDWAKRSSGKCSEGMPPRSVFLESRLTTCDARAPSSAAQLEQIQMLLGHASVQTTERYLGTKQDLVHAPNDAIRLKVSVSP
jgi:integrase